MASSINYLASTGENMREYLTPDIRACEQFHTRPPSARKRINPLVMAPRRAQHNRVRMVLPPDFGRIAMALHGRRINHQVIDARNKTEHLFTYPYLQ
jgi:hypothetical protein